MWPKPKEYFVLIVLFICCACFGQTTNTVNVNNIASTYHRKGQQVSYEFPKGSGKSAAGHSALWIGGIDKTGQIKLAATTYNPDGDFKNGPLDTITLGTVEGLEVFSYAPSVKITDINHFIADYNSYAIETPGYNFDNNILKWPARSVGNNTTTKLLAPFADLNPDGIYDPIGSGEFPIIKGDQMMYLVTNDRKVHTESGGIPIGIEIHHEIYAYNCPDVIKEHPFLSNTVFHRYKIYHRSDYDLFKCVIGLWSASCIGNRNDDYIGSNPKYGYAYSYNGTKKDSIFGDLLPATAIALLKAPLADPNDGIDNNGNGITDEVNEEMSIPNVYYFKQGYYGTINDAKTNPEGSSPIQYYNYLTGFWKDGEPMTLGGDGYGGTVACNHIFSDETVPGVVGSYPWTEMSAGNVPGQRSSLVCTQAFTFKAQSSLEIAFAFVTSIDSTKPSNNRAAVEKLKEIVPKVSAFFRTPIDTSNCLETGHGRKRPPIFYDNMFPNPTSNGKITITSDSPVINYEIIDAQGKTIILNERTYTQKLELDLSALPKGLYILKIVSTSKIVLKKIIYS